EIETERVTAGKTACPGQRPFQGGAEHAVTAHLEGGSEIGIRDHRECGKRKCGECLLHVMHAPQGFSRASHGKAFRMAIGSRLRRGTQKTEINANKKPRRVAGAFVAASVRLRLVVNLRTLFLREIAVAQ